MTKNLKKIAIAAVLILIVKQVFAKKSGANWGVLVNPQYERNDSCGNGYYGASRGSQTHKGIDLVCTENQAVYAPFEGKITRSFNAYSDTNIYKGIELSNENGIKVKIMYVNPNYSLIGTYVQKGQQIATAQKISNKYTCNMIDHLHIEVWENGVNVNPSNFLF